MENKITKLIAVAALMGSSFSVSALPTLQTYIDGSTYDAATQTWVTNANSFTFSALGTNEGKGAGKGSIPLMDGTEVFISVAIDKNSLPTDGSITIDGTTIASSSFIEGIPPIGLNPTPPNNDELASHGVFETWFAEYSFTFDTSNGCLACVSDMAPSGSGTDKDGWIENFVIDIAGFDSVHFDLYTKSVDADGYTSIDHFAPFSHDSEFSRVPTPGILYLFGIGLLGMYTANRRKI